VPEADRGAFTFPGSNDAPNGFATAQAVPAAAGAPVLFEPGEIVAGVPTLDCTPPTSTTTTTVPSTTSSTVAPTTTTVPAGPSTTAVPTTVELGPAVTVVAPRPESAEVLGATQSPTAANLALTGASSSLPLAAGVALLLTGVALLAGARRRDGA
jgi:LPXTG-motif cell wall-anchored protein